MRLRTQRRSFGSFLLGAGVGVLLALAASVVLVGHQQHSKAHAHGRDSLPGELPGQGTDAGAGTDEQQASAAASMSPPPPPAPPQLAPLPDLDAVPHLFVTFGNAAYFSLAHNWAKSVQAIGAPFLMAAFDDKLMDLCAEHALPCTRVELPGLNDSNFRQDFRSFRLMGAVKIRFVSDLLEQHPRLPLVMVSDTDAVWLRAPWPYFEQRPRAEFFISTDCLSMQVEEEWKPNHGQPRCGHIPDNDSGRAFNTGMFAARNTPAARAFLLAWAGMLLDPSRERHTDPAHRGIDDQMALNLLFQEGGIVGAGPGDPRSILVYNRTLRTQPLPVALFSNGHISFTQRTPWKRGVAPIVIHNTFLRFLVAGKVARFREFGLWFVDPPEYYGAAPAGSPPGAPPSLKFLTWENDVQAFVARQEEERYGSKGHGAPLMEKNWLGLSYQLQALRDALAAARMLGRVLVLPTLWCWCDYDEHPLILESCRIRGTDLELPFQCPLDFLLPVGQLDSAPLPYRPAGFLDLPQVPATLRQSRSALEIAERRPEGEQQYPVPAHTVGHAAVVWPGIKEGELRRAAQPVEQSAVLVLRGQVPGFLGGFDDQQQSVLFDRQFSDAVLDWGQSPYWCCFTWWVARGCRRGKQEGRGTGESAARKFAAGARCTGSHCLVNQPVCPCCLRQGRRRCRPSSAALIDAAAAGRPAVAAVAGAAAAAAALVRRGQHQARQS
ncbi:hypothetical protein ABPG75_008778 [Micractinium tetrahymenae]